jgi:hypothetical protein
MDTISNGIVELDFGASGVFFIAKDNKQAKEIYRACVRTLSKMKYLFAIMSEREFSVMDIEGVRKPVKIFLEDDDEIATNYYDRKRWVRIDDIPNTW